VPTEEHLTICVVIKSVPTLILLFVLMQLRICMDCLQDNVKGEYSCGPIQHGNVGKRSRHFASNVSVSF
jgi:hypothetical protein